MLYGQIIVLLIILLALYYAGMITMDILAANKAKASEDAKAEETEIDISGLAESFEAVEIKRISRNRHRKFLKTLQPNIRNRL